MVETTLVDWSRLQFAMTAGYHWLFVPLTLGLAVIMAIMETIYVVKGDEFWKKTAKFWMKLFGINFAVGIATGIILEFEFGTNFSNYSWFVGDIFGAPLAIEGILAFFMEATFFAVMFFGWEKVGKRFHLASTWFTGIGAAISATSDSTVATTCGITRYTTPVSTRMIASTVSKIATALRAPSFLIPFNPRSMARMGTFSTNATAAPIMKGENSVQTVVNTDAIRSVSWSAQYRTMQPATTRKMFRIVFLFSSKSHSSFFLHYSA